LRDVAPRIVTLAAELGIDAVPALVGWERQGGKSYPLLDGVVVGAEHEQTLMAKYLEKEAEAAAAQRKRLVAEARNRWQQLLRAVWRRRTLRDTYDYDKGNGAAAASGSGSAAAAAHASPTGKAAVATAGGAAATTGDAVAASAAATAGAAHVHSYPIELQDHDAETGITRKKCVLCGLVIEVEEM
jgi:hypothetical protein